MDGARIVELHNRLRETQGVYTEVHEKACHSYTLSQRDPAVLAIEAEMQKARVKADEVRDGAVRDAEERIRGIEDEANTARQAVLDRRAEELEAARAAVKQADCAWSEIMAPFEVRRRQTRDACQKRLSQEADEARRVRDEVLRDLVMTVTGGPVRLPASPKRGHGSLQHVMQGRGWYLYYNCHRRTQYVEPSVTIGIRIHINPETADVPAAPGAETVYTAIEVNTWADTLDEAQKQAEQKAIDAGWLIIGGRE